MRWWRAVVRAVLLAPVSLVPGGCTAAPDPVPVIDVDAPFALVDQIVRIRVTGLPAGGRVTLEATTTDGENQRWRSHSTFVADRSGVVDLHRHAPVEGTYAGTDGMGLFWSMVPVVGDPGTVSFVAKPPYLEPDLPVRIAVRDGDQELTHRDLTRRWLAPGVTSRRLSLDDDGLIGQLYLPPDGSPRRPGVLVFTGNDGLYDMHTPALLAARGYPALGLRFFDEGGLPHWLRDIPLEYFAQAARLLRTQPTADPGGIVAVASSRGTEAALLLADHYPELTRGVVLYAPNDQAGPGFPTPTGSAWSIAGRPVPVGRIPVDGVTAPVFAIAGDDDRLWPAAAQARRAIAGLPAANGNPPHRALVFPGAGHDVGVLPYLPAGGTKLFHRIIKEEIDYGGTRASNATARRDGWPQVLAFLESVSRPR